MFRQVYVCCEANCGKTFHSIDDVIKHIIETRHSSFEVRFEG
ncbi:MAG: hypothetical protein ACXQTI_06635 [Candidatus Nezhaarchaeales archaeon]